MHKALAATTIAAAVLLGHTSIAAGQDQYPGKTDEEPFLSQEVVIRIFENLDHNNPWLVVGSRWLLADSQPSVVGG